MRWLLSLALAAAFSPALGATLSDPEAVFKEVFDNAREWIEQHTDYDAPDEHPPVILMSQTDLRIMRFGSRRVLESTDPDEEFGTTAALVADGVIFLWEDHALTWLPNTLFHEYVHVVQGPPANARELGCNEAEAYRLEREWGEGQPQGPDPFVDGMVVIHNEMLCVFAGRHP